MNTARHWRNRAAGLVIISPSRRVYGADHGLHDSSGRSVLPERVASVTKTFAELGRRFAACKADVVIVVSPDHWVNFFINNLPSVCIGVGEAHEGSPEPWLKLPFQAFPGHPGLAGHLAETALKRDFDPSLSHHIKLDHGFLIPLWKMGLTRLPAIVPIIVNIIEPPLPSFNRCYAWGQLLRQAIEAYPGDLRVAVMATGGLRNAVCRLSATSSPKNRGSTPKLSSRGMNIGMKMTMISVHSRGQPSRKMIT